MKVTGAAGVEKDGYYYCISQRGTNSMVWCESHFGSMKFHVINEPGAAFEADEFDTEALFIGPLPSLNRDSLLEMRERRVEDFSFTELGFIVEGEEVMMWEPF